MAMTHSPTIRITEPSLGCAYSTGMSRFFRRAMAVGVSGKMAASLDWIISASLAELGMYSSTLGPMVSGHFLKPGS
ncbi:hypothetical protein D3C73_1300460 [compost metagenome]